MDKTILEIIVDICFRINDLKNQFSLNEPTIVNTVFRCDSEIRSEFDALISAYDRNEFLKKHRKIQDTIRLYLLAHTTTSVSYERKLSVIEMLNQLQVSLDFLKERILRTSGRID